MQLKGCTTSNHGNRVKNNWNAPHLQCSYLWASCLKSDVNTRIEYYFVNNIPTKMKCIPKKNAIAVDFSVLDKLMSLCSCKWFYGVRVFITSLHDNHFNQFKAANDNRGHTDNDNRGSFATFQLYWLDLVDNIFGLSLFILNFRIRFNCEQQIRDIRLRISRVITQKRLLRKANNIFRISMYRIFSNVRLLYKWAICLAS